MAAHNGDGMIRQALRETFSNLLGFTRWILAALLLAYLCSGIYSVASNEVGVLQRLGRVVDERVQPGIHYALPWPVDRVTKVPVKMVSRILIDDFYSAMDSESAARAFFNMTGLASYCISGDNNLVNVLCVIQYNILRPSDFLFRAEDPSLLLHNAACNTLVHCLSRMPVDRILTRGKQEIAHELKQGLQEHLDALHTGLGVSFVELADIKPPDRVQRYFSDVVKAQIDRDKMVNEAETYRNEKIPAAHAEAARLREAAEAYKAETVLKAEGDAERFRMIAERIGSRGAAREMIYVETLQEALEGVGRKHILSPDDAGDPPARLRIYYP